MRNGRRAAMMYFVAAWCFLVAGVVGLIADTEARIAGSEVDYVEDLAGAAFVVLSVAFAVLALNARKA